MKKLLLFILSFSTAGLVQAQDDILASRHVQPRNVTLELRTGIYCGNCPDGHAKAHAFQNAYPGRVVIIGIHAGGFAEPDQASHPDFTTEWGDAIAGAMGGAGYPAAMISRRRFPGEAGKSPYYVQIPPNMALSRKGWRPAGEEVMNNGGDTPMNIGAQTTWDENSRELSVDVEVYYTKSDSVPTNRVNVVLVEHGIIGYQIGATTQYEHNDVMRTMITGQWGDEITETTEGSTFRKTYTTTVDQKFNIDNCDIIIFTTKGDYQWSYTGIQLGAKNDIYVGVPKEELDANSLLVYPNPMTYESRVDFTLTQSQDVKFDVYDMMGALVGSHDYGTLAPGTHNYNINDITSELSTGMYVLQMTTENGVSSRRIVVE